MHLTRETVETYALATAGAIEGVWRYYVQPELTARRGWAAIGLGVLAYEMSCPQGELLSEGANRAIERHPLLVKAAIGYTALHLMNALPEQVDLFSQFTKRLK
jgi:hypothetical protein